VERRDVAAALGLVAFVLAIYLLTGPGRMDSMDVQLRFEVARGLLERGAPVLQDGAQLRARYVFEGVGGHNYSVYSAGGSLAGLPLVALGSWLGGESGDGRLGLMRVLFSWTSGVAGALIPALLFGAWRSLGVPRRAAAAWALVAAFATLAWPVSCSGFEQSQQSLLLLGATLAAWRAGGADGSRALAWVILGGLCGAALINYQEAYFLFLPLAAAACWSPKRPPIAALRRAVVFLFVALYLGAGCWMIWNRVRSGDALDSGKWFEGGGDVFGNPLVGVPGLLVSPGKGALWYSPPVLLALAGLPGLWRRSRPLALSAALSAAGMIVVFGALSFFGADRCWGPRLTLAALTLLALALPFVVWPRWLVAGIVAAGVGVQGLALSMDHHRFFNERALEPLFYLDDPGFYFRESALLARPGEALDAAWGGVGPEVTKFARSPYPRDVTYPPVMFIHAEQAPALMADFAVHQLPRPWPLWAPRLPEGLRYPAPVAPLLAGLMGLAAAGAGLLGWGIRR